MIIATKGLSEESNLIQQLHSFDFTNVAESAKVAREAAAIELKHERQKAQTEKSQGGK